MRRLAAILCAIGMTGQTFVVAASVLLIGPDAHAQETTGDPFLDEVNAELERGADGASEQGRAAAPTTGGWMYYLRALSSLLLVLALIVVGIYVARRFLARTPMLAGTELGRILGQMHLARDAKLYFVESGGRVLVIGHSGQTLSAIAEFDAAEFAGDSPRDEPASADSFLAHLESSARSMLQPSPTPAADDEMLSLRRDIERLQEFLREESRGTRD